MCRGRNRDASVNVKIFNDNFYAFLTQPITIAPSGDSKAPNTLQIALYNPLVVDLKNSVPPLWIIQSHLFGLSGIQEYVDLDPWVGVAVTGMSPYVCWSERISALVLQSS